MEEKVGLMEQLNQLEKEGIIVEEVVENRTFLLLGEINEETVREFHSWKESLMELETPVTILINCYGGCSDSMFAIIAMMEEFTEIHGRVLNSCYSAALGIFCSCHKRSMARYAEVMYHLCLFDSSGNRRDHKNQIKIADKIQDNYEDVIMRGSTLKKNEFKRSKDWYINREECKKIGIVNTETL